MEEEEENNDVYRPNIAQFELDEPPKLSEPENSNILQCDSTLELDDLEQLMPSSPPHEPELPEESAGVVIEEEEEEEEEPAGASRASNGKKRKRGRPARSAQKKPVQKKEEEDLCFICFDGGNLVVCDRRGCPKVYHPTCVNRDEAFFKTRGRWNCGWHFCSNCEKPAQHMCYTCPYSLCKGCIKEIGFFCVRGNKGFCETCMRTVLLIEKQGETNQDMAQVDFDDKNGWEYLFKDYWLDLKRKLSLTMEELNGATNPYMGSRAQVRSEEASSGELYDANDNQDSSSENSSGNIEVGKSTRRKAKRRSRSSKSEEDSPAGDGGVSSPKDTEWASKELLEFVEHMNDGDTTVLSQFDVQALLLEYIKRNNLRDPRRKSHILCDSRLQNLFGKERVGHFEMLKLLESHFLIKEDPSQGLADDFQEGAGEGDHMEIEGDRDSLPKKRKGRKKGEGKGLQANLDDYAAIDVHNINLIYLRRNLVEDLIEDLGNFQEKVTGCFVRIRISGTGHKQDMYRLVQVVGTSRKAEAYKSGKKTTDVLLDILNLSKTEKITIDSISNQEFSEEECNRLRQSIKCGLISRLTVGEIQEKARALQSVKVNDFLENEIQRLNHLRDRASEKGRRKELRECVEKLQLLSTPEERYRRLEELPEVHADPKMDPSYESDDNDGDQDDKQQDYYSRSRDSGFVKRGREMVSPGSQKASSNTWEQSRKTGGWDKADGASVGGSRDLNSLTNDTSSNRKNKPSWNQGRERQGDTNPSSNWDAPKNQVSAAGNDTWKSQGGGSNSVADWSMGPDKSSSNLSSGFVRPPGPPSVVTETAPAPPLIINEAEKMWHYQDPSGKIQGPFSMAQLRKWSTTGYFPADLRIWKTSEKQEDSILLTDALMGKLQKQTLTWDSQQNSFSQAQRDARLDNRENSREGGWSGNHNLARIEVQRIGGASWNSNWNDPSRPSNGIVEPVKTDGWDSSRGANTWSGPPQGHSPGPGSTFTGNQFRAPSHQGRGGRGGGGTGRWNPGQNHANAWNSSRPIAPNNWGSPGQSSGMGWQAQPENASLKDWSAPPPVVIPADGWGSGQMGRNDSMNLPTPTTPTPTGRGWMGGQRSGNKWSGPPVPAQPTTPVAAPRHSWNQQASLMAPESGKVSAGWGEPASTNASAWGSGAQISVNNMTPNKWPGPPSVTAQPTNPPPPPRHSWNQQASPMTPESSKVSVGWGEQASSNISAWGTGAQISENNMTPNKWSGPTSVSAQPTNPAPLPRHSWNQQASPVVHESSKVSTGWGEQASTNASAWGTGAQISENNQTTQSTWGTGSRPQPIKVAYENPQTFEPSSSSAAGSESTGLAANAAVAADSRPDASRLVPSESLTPGSIPPEKKDGCCKNPDSGDQTSEIQGSSPKPVSSSLDGRVGGDVPVQSSMVKDQVQGMGSENQGLVPLPAANSSQANTKDNWTPFVGSEEKGLGVPGSVLPDSPTQKPEQPSGSGSKPMLESHGWGQSSPQKLDASGSGSEAESQQWGSAPAQKPVAVDSSSKLAHDSQGWGSAFPSGSGTEPGLAADGWNTVSSQKAQVAAVDGGGDANTVACQSTLPTSSLANQDPPSSNDPWKTSPAVEPSAPASSGWGSIAQSTDTVWGGQPTNTASTAWGTADGDSNTGWGTANKSWGTAVGSNTGWGSGSENPNTGWGSGPGSSNAGWGSQQRQDGERFSGQGDDGFHSGDSGPGGWPRNNNRQYGDGGSGGGPRGGPRGPKVCKFHESGFCKKGAACNFFHP